MKSKRKKKSSRLSLQSSFYIPYTKRTFTIVELLVVIVVIGIVAAITFVTYGTLSQRAITAVIQSDLSNASTVLKTFQLANSNYPATLNCAQPESSTNTCVRLSGGNYVNAYVYDNTSAGSGFCLNIKNGSLSYKISSKTYPTPSLGECGGGGTPPSPYITPGTYSYTIPSGVTSVQLSAYGASSGSGADYIDDCDTVYGGGSGALGGSAAGTLSVSAGNVLNISVGAAGTNASVVQSWPRSGASGSSGGESYVQLGGVYQVRGYGATGGQGAYDTYTGGGLNCDGNSGANGTAGSGFVGASLTGAATATGVQSGNGKVVINFTAVAAF